MLIAPIIRFYNRAPSRHQHRFCGEIVRYSDMEEGYYETRTRGVCLKTHFEILFNAVLVDYFKPRVIDDGYFDGFSQQGEDIPDLPLN